MEENRFLYKSANHAINLNNMRLDNKWCDVIIKVDQREFHAHKVILAANLKYFNTMFSNDWFRESKQDIIPMEFIDGTNLEVFVSYAYTGEILLTDSNVMSLLEFANYLGEDNIKDVCIEFLEKHLKAEQVCRIYKLADTIDCLSLKIAARKTILSNFGYCSGTAEFFDFTYEDLVNILVCGKGYSVETQTKFFEGIMRWIIYDVNERRNGLIDLLKLIDVRNVTADYLLSYLFGNVLDYKDEYGIMKDVMAYYHSNKNQETKYQTLTVVSFCNRKLTFQSCNFINSKWSSVEEIPNVDNNVFSTSAVLNGELYHTSENHKTKCINVFNPTIKRSTVLHSSYRIISGSALCACSRFLYLCGGEVNGEVTSNQFLKYDPLTNGLETLIPMKVQRSNAAAIFYQGYLLILGGWNETSRLRTVEKYDPDTKTWMEFPSMCQPRSSHAVAILDGKLYSCGGFTRSVEVYDPLEKSWQLVASMREERHTFVVVAHEDKLIAIGGDDEGTVEVYDPLVNKWQINYDLSSGLRIWRVSGGFISYDTANTN